MPMYEYECENCGTRFDRIQSINDEPVRQCPECAGAVHKVFHAAGLIFKGSGWYITDSRKAASSAVTGETKPASGDKPPAEGGVKTEAKPDATAATKTETKSETKSDPK
jgi:putative FmdB family regulatory protein